MAEPTDNRPPRDPAPDDWRRAGLLVEGMEPVLGAFTDAGRAVLQRHFADAIAVARAGGDVEQFLRDGGRP